MKKLETNWISNNTKDSDRTGVGHFEIDGMIYNIPFRFFDDYYIIISIIKEHEKYIELKTLNNIKSRLDILIQETEHLDY